MKIGIYVSELGKAIDGRNVHQGNPGLGGTEYLMILLSHYLDIYQKNAKIYLFSHQNILLENNVINVICDETNLNEQISKNFIDILIVKSSMPLNLFEKLAKLNLKIIVWGHNYYLSDFADYIAQSPQVKANVFVSKQQYDRYIDHPIIDKSIPIFNMVPNYTSIIQRNLSSNIVLYIGALIPSKGFHLLAQIWKKIILEVPSAQLYVMGSGNLYNNNQTLGKYGIAEATYEDSFMKFLTDSQGKILKSVHFLGVIKEDKLKYLSQTSVGVVNPSGKTETFGMGIIEMNRAGIPVVTINKNGYPDTIINNETGFLCKNLNDIQSKIIFLLKNKNTNIEMGIKAKERAELFTPESIIQYWITLINNINLNKFSFEYIRPTSNFCNNHKWLRIIIRFVRYKLKIKKLPPLINFETFIYKKIR